MSKDVTIAVDAMGGDGSPKKVIDGISNHYKNSKNTFYRIFGDEDQIKNLIPKTLSNNNFEIIHTKNFVKGTDTPLEAAKRGKDTSMWLAIENVKNKEADTIISAGNTGALLDIAKNKGPSQSLVIIGVSAWTEGQLEGEIDKGHWNLSEVTQDILFQENNEKKYIMATKNSFLRL